MQQNENRSGLIWLWLSALVVVLDHATKFLATQNLTLHDPVPIMPGFNLTLAHNYGAAFSFLHDAGGWQRWFFLVLAIAISIVLVVWLKRLRAADKWVASAVALILGGAIGNVWDRARLGYVVDFIDVYYQQWHWPAFNIADSAISIGAVMLIIDSLRGNKAVPGKAPADKQN